MPKENTRFPPTRKWPYLALAVITALKMLGVCDLVIGAATTLCYYLLWRQ